MAALPINPENMEQCRRFGERLATLVSMAPQMITRDPARLSAEISEIVVQGRLMFTTRYKALMLRNEAKAGSLRSAFMEPLDQFARIYVSPSKIKADPKTFIAALGTLESQLMTALSGDLFL